jgi:hypothetical protein
MVKRWVGEMPKINFALRAACFAGDLRLNFRIVDPGLKAGAIIGRLYEASN